MSVVSRRVAVLGTMALGACASATTASVGARTPVTPSKRVLVFGDSISWGVHSARIGIRRLPFHQRWGGVAQTALGADYEIVEDCLPGRTAGVDRPSLPALTAASANGLTELPEALMRNVPLSLVVLQLGTNDMLLDSSLSGQTLAHRIGALADIVAGFLLPIALEGMPRPARTLVMAPTAIGETQSSPNGLAAESLRPNLLPALEAEGARKGFVVFDGAQAVPNAPPDGLHFDEQGHARLGALAADAIRRALST